MRRCFLLEGCVDFLKEIANHKKGKKTGKYDTVTQEGLENEGQIKMHSPRSNGCNLKKESENQKNNRRQKLLFFFSIHEKCCIPRHEHGKKIKTQYVLHAPE